MQKVNELFGKRVINQLSGDQVASVRDVVLDNEARQIVALVLTSGRSSDEHVARMGQILGMGEFVVVDGTKPLQPSASDSEIVGLRKNAQQITGKKLMSVTGEQVGTVGDMYVGRGGAIIGFELKHGPFGGDPQVFRATDVQSVGKDAVIVKTPQPIALSVLAAEEAEWLEPVQAGHVDSLSGERAEHAA